MRIKDSIVLGMYLFVASTYFLFNDFIRLPFFGISLLLALYMGVRIKKGVPVLKIPVSLYVVSTIVFSITLLVQFVNGILTPFVVYYLSAPLVAYFICTHRFNIRVVSLPFYLFSLYVFFYFLMHHNLFGVMGAVSENYVSVVLIMNLVIIYTLRFRQNAKIVYIPSIIAFLLSILAIGMAWILMTLFILLLVVWVRWKDFSRKNKILSILAVLVPLLVIVFLKWDLITTVFSQMEVFQKFANSGVDSPSRDIIKREYLAHIDEVTLFTGYNYADNYWFQHYGLNPHNSYIRLHYFSGFAFFIVIPLILLALFKLVRQNLFFAGLLFAILLRSWTDSVLFLTLFDFVPLVLIIIAFYESKNKNVNG